MFQMNIVNYTPKSPHYFNSQEPWQLGKLDFEQLAERIAKQEDLIENLTKQRETLQSQLKQIAMPLDFDLFGIGRKAYLMARLHQLSLQIERAEMYLKGFRDIINRQKVCLII